MSDLKLYYKLNKLPIFLGLIIMIAFKVCIIQTLFSVEFKMIILGGAIMMAIYYFNSFGKIVNF